MADVGERVRGVMPRCSFGCPGGPIRVRNDQRALKAGESLSAEGLTIEVTAASAAGDTLSLTLSP